jgi:hypothetical protein
MESGPSARIWRGRGDLVMAQRKAAGQLKFNMNSALEFASLRRTRVCSEN